MKYRLTDETKEWCGHTLHKIEYTAEWLKEQGLDATAGEVRWERKMIICGAGRTD